MIANRLPNFTLEELLEQLPRYGLTRRKLHRIAAKLEPGDKFRELEMANLVPLYRYVYRVIDPSTPRWPENYVIDVGRSAIRKARRLELHFLKWESGRPTLDQEFLGWPRLIHALRVTWSGHPPPWAFRIPRYIDLGRNPPDGLMSFRPVSPQEALRSEYLFAWIMGWTEAYVQGDAETEAALRQWFHRTFGITYEDFCVKREAACLV
jgi:hypothetical protein